MVMVSVIIPTYKRSDMLKRAIDSALNQTYENIEVIVVDDNDPESIYRKKTSTVMLEYKGNSNVRYIKHKKNYNGAVARNTGLSNSVGDLITFLDDDDWYHSEKVEEQVDYLLNNKQYKAAYCGWKRRGKEIKPSLKGDLSYQILSGEKVIRTNTIMIWRDVLEEIGGWREDFIRNQEASLLLDYFDKGYKIGVVSKVLVYYDISDRRNSLSTERNKEQFDYLIKEFEHTIQRIEKNKKDAKKEIIASRYTAILLSYLKEQRYIKATSHYFINVISNPIFFNKKIIKYIINRLKGEVS